MAKLIFKLKSVSQDEADDIKNLLSDNDIDFYESPPGNWEISLHGLWLNDDNQYTRAKQLIDEYQLERTRRMRLEMQQKKESGEVDTLFQRILNRPVQFIFLIAFIFFILYLTVMPFLQFGQE